MSASTTAPRPTLEQLIRELESLADPEFARVTSGFFKTGPGEYGEGDVFIGVRVPEIRTIAKKFRNLELEAIDELASSKIHEHRFCALVILLGQFEGARGPNRTRSRGELFERYLSYYDRGFVNNWDLVDISAPRFGVHLLETGGVDRIRSLSNHSGLWHQRVAIMFTWPFLKAGDFSLTLEIAERYLTHEHDLIHKASGWMLRELGKRDLDQLRRFLAQHAAVMPRVMLRYAIEKMGEAERKRWLSS